MQQCYSDGAVVQTCYAMLAVMLLLPGLARADAVALSGDDYHTSLESWKAARLASLKGPSGYLNLAGLFWLKQQQSTFGSAADSDIVFPPAAPPNIGVFQWLDGQVVLAVQPQVIVLHEGTPVTRIRMLDDASEAPVTVAYGSLTWTVIQRDGKFAVRLRDFDHPALRDFPGIDYYLPDTAMQVRALLEPYAVPREVRVDTVIEGLDYRPRSPGILKFLLGGEAFELEAYQANDQLLLIFGDQTSGYDTYPAGRFLYADQPDQDGYTMLDFNKAENPPCAFNDFATCPVASPRNRLKTRVEAGERFDPSSH